jgi:Tol biopolymer transport system component
MDSDGAGKERIKLGADAAPRSVLYGWSPDGSRLLFEYVNDDDHELYLINADGSNFSQLTVSEGWSEYASFSPTAAWWPTCS